MKRRKKKKPKREQREIAALGGSEIARSAFTRPGGLHGRRKPQRRVERERAIKEAS